jgi:hypothetical protein
MRVSTTLTVVSDIHYAGPAEAALGHPRAGLGSSAWQNAFMRAWDRWIWLHDPLGHNGLVEEFLARVPTVGRVVANGDFALDTAAVGMSDPAALASAQECLGKLRRGLGDRLRATIGDHELGKLTFVGGKGGLRLASWHATTGDLGLAPFWEERIGNLVLIGVTSSVVGLDLLRPDALAHEWSEWVQLRAAHQRAIGEAFSRLSADERVILFCHDPSALPFLREIPEVERNLARIERTVVGHLHSRIVFATCRVLAGVPRTALLGTTVQRWTAALNRVRAWRPFKPVLCPSLAGIELAGHGGWLELSLDAEAGKVTGVTVRPMPRQRHARR